MSGIEQRANIKRCVNVPSAIAQKPLVKYDICWKVPAKNVKRALLLNHLRVRGLEQAFIHACLSFSAMLVVALTAVRQHKPNLIRSIKHYTTQ